MIRLSGSQLQAARVLVGLSRVLQWFAARLPSDEHFHSFSAR
jgi:hypothetical protein